MEMRIPLASWKCEIPETGDLANLELQLSGSDLVAVVEHLQSKKHYLVSFRQVLGYRFESAFYAHRLGNKYKVVPSPWIEAMNRKPFRVDPLDTAQHYLICLYEGELEVVAMGEPVIEVESRALDGKTVNCIDNLVSDLGKGQCETISRKVIRTLTAMTDGMQSGDDSGLENIWEEVCVQSQSDVSWMWDLYLETMESLVSNCIAEADIATRQAMWLQTDQGKEWAFDTKKESHSNIPFVEDEIVTFILDEFVLRVACNWSNVRVDQFLNKDMDD